MVKKKKKEKKKIKINKILFIIISIIYIYKRIIEYFKQRYNFIRKIKRFDKIYHICTIHGLLINTMNLFK